MKKLILFTSIIALTGAQSFAKHRNTVPVHPVTIHISKLSATTSGDLVTPSLSSRQASLHDPCTSQALPVKANNPVECCTEIKNKHRKTSSVRPLSHAVVVDNGKEQLVYEPVPNEWDVVRLVKN